jgi:hypothetical protein
MTKDVNMQHMTMKEYIAVAVLSEQVANQTVLQGIAKGLFSPEDIIRECFGWAEAFMKVRNETKTTQPQ